MSIDWNRFCEVIRSYDKFVLVSHIRPDCDALGSELGMAMILEKIGKQVRIVNGQAIPPNLQFIDKDRKIKTIHVDITPQDLHDVECFMVLDTSARIQLGPMLAILDTTGAKKVILDHHLSEDELGAEVFKLTSAEATGVLVLEAAEQLHVELDPNAAQALFAAIATDTGWFRFKSVSAGTFDSISKLIRAGAVPAQVYQDLYERETVGRVRLRGLVLSRVEVELDCRLVHTYILKEDYPATGSLPSDTEDLINGALEVNGTQFAVIFVEQPSGGVKISFRSRCPIRCNEIAANFGGGGHQAAAGAFIKTDMETARREVLNIVRSAFEEAA